MPVRRPNQWANRHRERLQQLLEPDERLLAADRVVVRRSAGSPLVPKTAEPGLRGPALGSLSRRWRSARYAGFPVPGPIFVLALSDRRLLFVSGTRWLARPQAVGHAMALDRVADLRVVRRFPRRRLALFLVAGQTLVVQSLRGNGIRDLEQAFDTRA
jgi:hypothetical protein